MSKKQEELIYQDFLKKHPEYAENDISVESYSDDKELSKEICELILSNEKQATSSLLYWSQNYDVDIAKVNDLEMVIDASGKFYCIVLKTAVKIVAYKDITAEHAFLEGEGDKTLEYYKEAHSHYFYNDLINEDIEFNEDMLVVCEYFKVIYQ